MGKHRLDKTQAFQIIIRETSLGQWKEWVRAPNGSGSGQTLPFNSLHNAIMYGIRSVREDYELYGAQYGPEYHITIVASKYKSEHSGFVDSVRHLAYDGGKYGEFYRT